MRIRRIVRHMSAGNVITAPAGVVLDVVVPFQHWDDLFSQRAFLDDDLTACQLLDDGLALNAFPFGLLFDDGQYGVSGGIQGRLPFTVRGSFFR